MKLNHFAVDMKLIQHCKLTTLQLKKKWYPTGTILLLHTSKYTPNKMKVKSLSCVWLFATPWIVAYHAPPSMEFSRQEYWSWLPFPSPGDLPNPDIEPESPESPALAGGCFTSWATREPPCVCVCVHVCVCTCVYTCNRLPIILFICTYIYIQLYRHGLPKPKSFPLLNQSWRPPSSKEP